MDCPHCGYHDSKVIDSRDVNDGIRRRRQCLGCSARFTTYERLQLGGLFVVKKDKRREEFSKDKLLTGIRKACEKRPLPIGIIDKLADDVETELHDLGRAEIPSAVIGDRVMQRLKSLDHIAYIRFASVYRKFTDITTLKREIDSLLGTGAGESPAVSQLSLLPGETSAAPDKRRHRSRK